MCFSPDGKRLASGSYDQTVKVWEARTGQQALSLQGHTGAVISVCFSPDGKRLASGSGDQTVRVRDAHTGTLERTLQGHTGSVESVCFSPDGKRLVSRDSDGEQITWDLGTGRPIAGATEVPVSPSPRSPDGRFFALAQGIVIRLYRLPSGTPEERAAGRKWVDPDYRWHATQAQQSWQTGDWFAVAFHLNRQLPERPWDAGLHLRHAYALRRLGRTAEATTHFLHAVLLNPHIAAWPLDPDVGRRGQMAAQAGDWPRAVADLELAAHQPAATLATWSDLLVARRAAAPKDARQSCRELLDRFESNPRASAPLLDSCRITACDASDARRLVKVAERLLGAGRNTNSLSFLGSALYRAGRFEEAARTLEESIKFYPRGGSATTWVFLAMTQQRLGRGKEARMLLARSEDWLKVQRFATWQQGTRWRLLHEEARGLILTMPQAEKEH